MTKKLFFATAILLAIGISGCENKKTESSGASSSASGDTAVISKGISSKGIGRFKEVPLNHPLDSAMIEKGQAMFNAKCIACHKLTSEKLVGPGWKGVTDRRKPEWIMNFITNTEVMLDKDLAAQAEIVTCVVRMPKQDLTDEQARGILEFMLRNDDKN